MLRLLSDEDFSGRIVRGVFRRLPNVDLVRVQDVNLLAAIDPDILAFAASDGRLLLTHDAQTMPVYAYDRVKAGKPMPGVIICPQRLGIGDAVRDIALLAELSDEDEWKDQVIYLPL